MCIAKTATNLFTNKSVLILRLKLKQTEGKKENMPRMNVTVSSLRMGNEVGIFST